MKHAIQHLHFVGIGGAGMSAIAEMLHRLGYRISGSDQAANAFTQRLSELGATVFIGHAASHIEGAQAVVTSSAIRADNAELVAAREQRIPVVARAVVLAELMRFQRGIAIAGTHGKTTTTALVASVLIEAGVDPSFVIGGTMHVDGRGAASQGAGRNSHLGKGDFIVVEADESDASFLHLSPVLCVVTNIDADHMETYGHDTARLHGAFVDFIHRLPFYGRAVLCGDDSGVRAIVPRLARPLLTYGLDEGTELRAVDALALPGGRMRFSVRQAGRPDLPVVLNLAGLHNVRNALAAIAVARELHLPDAPVAAALAGFQGVDRRFENYGELPIPAAQGGGSYTLVDDYGHHPAELAAVLAAARGAFPGRRLLLAFQPHRYSRTRDCFDDFVGVLRGFDAVLLTDVYAAGEAPIAGADSAALAAASGGAVFVPGVAALAAAIAGSVQGGDVVITMGAGSIGKVPAQLLKMAKVSR